MYWGVRALIKSFGGHVKLTSYQLYNLRDIKKPNEKHVCCQSCRTQECETIMVFQKALVVELLLLEVSCCITLLLL